MAEDAGGVGSMLVGGWQATLLILLPENSSSFVQVSSVERRYQWEARHEKRRTFKWRWNKLAAENS